MNSPRSGLAAPHQAPEGPLRGPGSDASGPAELDPRRLRVGTEGPTTSLRHAALLARLLAEAMIANVQTTAALHRAAADALLAQARLATPIRFTQLDDAWSASWHRFEHSARTADQMLGLARGHVERSTFGLARITERLFTELAELQAHQIDPLREAFDALRAAQENYLQSTQQAHRRILALARPAAHGDHDAQ